MSGFFKEIIFMTFILVSRRTLEAYPTKEEFQQVTHRQFKLGLDMMKLVQHHDPGNVIISPVINYGTLALAYIGSDGTTREQYTKNLRINPRSLEVSREITALLAGSSRTYNVRQATAMYLDESVEIKDSYNKQTRRAFFVAPLKINFKSNTAADEINEFMSRATADGFGKVVKEDDIKDAMMVLISGISLKAGWKYPFNIVSSQRKAKFSVTHYHTAEVDNMIGTQKLFIGNVPGVDARILELKFKDDQLKMYIILPDDPMGLCKVQEALTKDRLFEAMKTASHKVVKVVLPRLRFSPQLDLTPVLKSLKFTKMFSSNANFSRISSQPLSVRVMYQGAPIHVNEYGTNDAEPKLADEVQEDPTDEFIVEHPFFFFIVEPETDAILYLGRVIDPSGKVTSENVYKCNVGEVGVVGDGSVAPRVSFMFIFSTIIFVIFAIAM